MKAKETLDLISKQWATKNDIQKIGCVGINKANEIKKKIANDLIGQGYNLPYNLVPMEKVVDYFKINVNYLKRFANLERG